MKQRTEVDKVAVSHDIVVIENQKRVEYAQMIIEHMAVYAVRTGQSGTIGLEIPVKDGRLGKVKQISIVFQPE
jgi:hypothetical protein